MTPPHASSTARPITIGFDASSTVGDRTGIGYAAARLLTTLAEQLPERWNMKALVNSGRLPLPAADPWMHAPNVHVRHTRIPGRVLLRGWQYVKFPPIELLLGAIDLHHNPASYITPALRARSILTVHDLFFLEGDEMMDPYGAGYFARTFASGLPRCRRIIAVSNHTRDHLLRQYALDPERIDVVPHGIDTDFFRAESGEADASIIEPWSKGEPYLLCVASIGPKRKNLPGLIDAYARARQRAPDIPALLITGGVEKHKTKEALDRQVASLRLGSHVRFTGYVAHDHLPAIYRGARALIVPSLDEGFGMPVLEAMACGCPVLAARAGSLPEIAGDAALIADASPTGDFAQAMVRVATDRILRERLKADGTRRAAEFTWRSAARRTLDIYADVLDRERK